MNSVAKLVGTTMAAIDLHHFFEVHLKVVKLLLTVYFMNGYLCYSNGTTLRRGGTECKEPAAGSFFLRRGNDQILIILIQLEVCE